jgi:hypothetical protein
MYESRRWVVIFVGRIEHAELNNLFGSGEEIKGLGVDGGCTKLSEGSNLILRCRINRPITKHRPIIEHPCSVAVGLC